MTYQQNSEKIRDYHNFHQYSHINCDLASKLVHLIKQRSPYQTYWRTQMGHAAVGAEIFIVSIIKKKHPIPSILRPQSQSAAPFNGDHTTDL